MNREISRPSVEEGLIRRLLRSQPLWKQTPVKSIPMWMGFIQPIPTSAPRRESYLKSLMMRCWRWPVWGRKYYRSVLWSLLKNTMFPFMWDHLLMTILGQLFARRTKRWKRLWFPVLLIIKMRRRSRSCVFPIPREWPQNFLNLLPMPISWWTWSSRLPVSRKVARMSPLPFRSPILTRPSRLLKRLLKSSAGKKSNPMKILQRYPL